MTTRLYNFRIFSLPILYILCIYRAGLSIPFRIPSPLPLPQGSGRPRSRRRHPEPVLFGIGSAPLPVLFAEAWDHA